MSEAISRGDEKLEKHNFEMSKKPRKLNQLTFFRACSSVQFSLVRTHLPKKEERSTLGCLYMT